jgi:hypothetical protein
VPGKAAEGPVNPTPRTPGSITEPATVTGGTQAPPPGAQDRIVAPTRPVPEAPAKGRPPHHAKPRPHEDDRPVGPFGLFRPAAAKRAADLAPFAIVALAVLALIPLLASRRARPRG